MYARRRVLSVYGVPTEVRLKMRLLCIARGIAMGELLSEMVNVVWQDDGIVANDKVEGAARRLVKRAFKPK